MGPGQPCAPVGARETRDRLAREQKVLQHALFHQGQGLGLHAFLIHVVVAEQAAPMPLFLRGIIHHVHPFRQDTGALAAFELTRQRQRWAGPARSPASASAPGSCPAARRKAARRRRPRIVPDRYTYHQGRAAQSRHVLGHTSHLTCQFRLGWRMLETER